jgi:hypothetical protein
MGAEGLNREQGALPRLVFLLRAREAGTARIQNARRCYFSGKKLATVQICAGNSNMNILYSLNGM